MTQQEARAILQSLFNGIDPETGEVLPVDHVCSQTNVMRALFVAMQALNNAPVAVRTYKADTMAEPVKHSTQLNAARPWTQEDNQLLAQYCREGLSMDEICTLLHRRRRGVHKQMEALGLCSAKTGGNVPSRAGKSWSQEEEMLLYIMRHDGMNTAGLAEALGRSKRAIIMHMDQMKERGVLRAMPDTHDPILWTDPDMEFMQHLHAKGCTPDQIAQILNRSERSIAARLFYLGLSRDAPVRLSAPDEQ